MRTMIGPIEILVIMLIVAIIPATIILLIKGGKTVRWIIGGILLVVLLLFFGMFSLRITDEPAIVQQVGETSAHNYAIPVPASTPENPTLWQPHLEEELIPDIYSSKETAAYGLGMQLLETIQAASDTMPEKILILESSANSDLALLEQFRRGLKTNLSNTNIAISQSESPSPEKLLIALSILSDPKDHDILIPKLDIRGQIRVMHYASIGNADGRIQAVVKSPDGKFIKEVSYANRPWAFGGTQTLLKDPTWQPKAFRSYDTVATEEQALAQAVEGVHQYLNQSTASQYLRPGSLELDHLRDSGMLNDQYTQKLQGLSGPIWRAALLIDVHPDRLHAFQRSRSTAEKAIAAAEYTVRKSWAGLIGQFIGMIALIILVYIVINALTKGYYSVWLGFLAVLLVMILSGLILLMH